MRNHDWALRRHTPDDGNPARKRTSTRRTLKRRPDPSSPRPAGYRRGLLLWCLICWTLGSCGAPETDLPPDYIAIGGGAYSLGSDSTERELGYRLSPPAVGRAGWYDAWESRPRRVRLEPFAIGRAPVTQREYAEFVGATGQRRPFIEPEAYRAQGFLVHEYGEVMRFLWRDGSPPAGLESHPVTLVDREDARAYCSWRGSTLGLELRLPSEEEWEAACRGPEKRTFPWGSSWATGRAQIGDTITAAVGAHPDGATPDGVLDLAGNVFEWTTSPMPDGRALLKGCSFDDSPGTCRCAFRHGRPASSRHILIGFRCAVSR